MNLIVMAARVIYIPGGESEKVRRREARSLCDPNTHPDLPDRLTVAGRGEESHVLVACRSKKVNWLSVGVKSK